MFEAFQRLFRTEADHASRSQLPVARLGLESLDARLNPSPVLVGQQVDLQNPQGWEVVVQFQTERATPWLDNSTVATGAKGQTSYVTGYITGPLGDPEWFNGFVTDTVNGWTKINISGMNLGTYGGMTSINGELSNSGNPVMIAQVNSTEWLNGAGGQHFTHNGVADGLLFQPTVIH